MNLSEFVKNHCVGKQYDSCVESPCAFASHSGCRHPLHPKHAAQHLRAVDETTCACKDEAFINDETPGCCGNCGKPFRH